MIFHYLQLLKLPYPFDKLIFFGGTGVHLFVVLSGFGLALSYANRPLRYKVFLQRRISKVYIPYIAIVLISALASVFIPIYPNSLYALGGHVLLYKMFDESIIGSYGYQLWFISMILQFYLLFHILVWLKRKLSQIPFFILSVLISVLWSSAIASFGLEDIRVWNSFFLRYLWEFALGMILSDLVLRDEPLFQNKHRFWISLVTGVTFCLVFAFLGLYGGSKAKLFNDLFALVGYSMLAVSIYLVRLGWIRRFFKFIGGISMSVYLIHMLVVLVLLQLFPYTSRLYLVATSIATVIPLSMLYQTSVNYFFRVTKL